MILNFWRGNARDGVVRSMEVTTLSIGPEGASGNIVSEHKPHLQSYFTEIVAFDKDGVRDFDGEVYDGFFVEA